MRIVCIDQSNGKLFFAGDFLSKLNILENESIFQFTENISKIYGSFFDHFNRIKISHNSTSTYEKSIQIIFSDFKNLTQKTPKNTLIYPLIMQNELSDYQHLLSESDNEFRRSIIQIDIPDLNNHIYQPASEWAIDVLQRKIGYKPLFNKCILISGGPTIEDIDPVRYITNRSSGKMGLALARAAYILGADVQFIYGPGSISLPSYLNITRVRSAKDMYEAVMDHFNHCHVYIGSAAIADFTPSTIHQNKIKKADGFSEIYLQPTKDILIETASIKKNQLLIGFSVETEDTIKNSQSKLIRKKLDLIVVNNPRDKGSAFDTNTNKVSIIDKNGHLETWPKMSKFDVAKKIMQKINVMLG